MTIDPEFAEMMVDTITAAAPTTRNFRGEASYGVAVPYQARVVRTLRMVRNTEGDVLASKTQAWVFGAPGLTASHKVTLPDGTSPPIMYVEQFPDENGPHHEVVYFGDVQ